MEVISSPLRSSYAEIIPQITIREVCEILDIDLPNETNTDCFESIDLDKKCTVCATTWSIKEDSIVFLRKGGADVYFAAKNHASMIIGDFAYRNTNAYSVKYPKGMTAKSAYTEVCRFIKNKYNVPCIAITGNAGKTTTKDLISSIFIRQKKTLCVQKNYNTWYTAGETLQNLTGEHELYIQEVHEPHADVCSRMLQPDVVVLTNLERAHLDETGASLENSIKATLKILNDIKDSGVIFANSDCPYLSKEKFQDKKVIWYGSDPQKCDYWVENIKNFGEYITFKIYSKTDAPVDIRLNISGVHNANNAAAAYAVGRYYNVSSEDIVESLSTYKPDGVRQNLVLVNGRYVLIDCYSTTVISSVTAGKNLCSLPMNDGGKRVMVLSYLPTLGAGSETVHRDVGRGIAQLPIDKIIGYRNDAKYIVDECVKAGKDAVFFQHHKDVIEYLNSNLGEKDIIAFKGVTYAHLEQVANAVLNLNIIPENRIENDRIHNGGDF